MSVEITKDDVYKILSSIKDLKFNIRYENFFVAKYSLNYRFYNLSEFNEKTLYIYKKQDLYTYHEEIYYDYGINFKLTVYENFFNNISIYFTKSNKYNKTPDNNIFSIRKLMDRFNLKYENVNLSGLKNEKIKLKNELKHIDLVLQDMHLEFE